MRSSSCSKIVRAAALACVAVLAACDLGTDPPAPITVSFSFDLGPSSGAAQNATSAQLRVTHASGSLALDTTVAVVNGAVAGSSIEIPLESPDEILTAKADLLDGTTIIFTGTSSIQAVAGQALSTTIVLDPVVASVVVEGPLEVFSAIGDDATLVGHALFSNGDTVPGVVLTWTSDDPSVVVVEDTDRLVATGEGSTSVRGAVGDRFGTLQARVEAVVVTIVIAPEELVLARGAEVQVMGRAEDANGNALVRNIGWSSLDPMIAAVDAAGIVTAVNPGGTTLVGEVGDVMGSTTVEVTPAPPSVTSPTVSTPGTRSVTLSTDINPNGAATVAVIQWSTTADFIDPLSGPEASVGDGLDAVGLQETLTRLMPSTAYYVRVAATNAYGETFTDVVEIVTMDPSGGFVDGLLSAEGEPVEGATIQLDNGPTTLTDASGFYSFDDVEVGQHQLTIVSLPVGFVFQTTTAPAVITQVGELVQVDFEGAILRTSKISGVVTASGLGVANANVHLEGPDSRVVATDGLGKYSFDSIRAGDYTVTIAGFDGSILQFGSTSTSVSVGLNESVTVSFSGVDLDLLNVSVSVWIGSDALARWPVPGATVGIFPTQVDAAAKTNVIGSAGTNSQGTAIIRIRKRDDSGPGGTPSDSRVWSSVTAFPAGNMAVTANATMAIDFAAGASAVSAPDTVAVLNGTVALRSRIQTIITPRPDSGLLLHTWAHSAYADTSAAPVAASTSIHGNVNWVISRPVASLPDTIYIRVNSNQPLAATNDWTQTPEGVGAGRYLMYVMDGFGPPATGTPIDVGLQRVEYTTMSVWTGTFHEADNTSSVPVRSPGDDFPQATTIDVQLRRGGAVIDTRDVVASGHIPGFPRRPVPDNLTLTVSSTDGSITFITPTSIVVGAPGGGSVGTIDADGGYRHSARVCPLAADTIIGNCVGFAYKFNNTRISGTITQGGGGAGGVNVTIARCRTPQPFGGIVCFATDGFTDNDTTSGGGAYNFPGLLEGIYQVSAGGVSRLVQTKGKGDQQTQDLGIP